MIYLVSIFAVMLLLGGAIAVIGTTLHSHADAIVAALAGRSIRAGASTLPEWRVRVAVRTPWRRPPPMQPLRAAA